MAGFCKLYLKPLCYHRLASFRNLKLRYIPPPRSLFLSTWLFSCKTQMHTYHRLFAFLYVFAISTVTMETLLATTLVRSNGIRAFRMWTAFVLIWGAFVYILTFFHLAIITRFAFASETSGNISTHGISVFFAILLKWLKKNHVTTWTQSIEGGPSIVRVSFNDI